MTSVPKGPEANVEGVIEADKKIDAVKKEISIVDLVFDSIIEESLTVSYDAKNEAASMEFEFEGNTYRFLYRTPTESLTVLRDGLPLGENTFESIEGEIKEYLKIQGEALRKQIESKEMETLRGNLRRAANYTEEVLIGTKGIQYEDELVHYADKIRALRIGDRFYGVEFIGSIYEKLLREKFETYSIHIKFLPIQGNKNIRIALSINGKSGYTGSIESTSESPFYRLSLDDTLPGELRGSYRQTLMNMLEILGIAGNAKNHNDGMVRKRTRDAIVDPNQFNPSNSEIDQKSALRVLERVEQGKAKFLRAFYDADGIRQYEIISTQEEDEITDDTLVILHDENLASTDQAFNRGIYQYIRNSLRLKKYLILRVMSTILGEKYKGKDELTGSMRTVFVSIWDDMSQGEQDAFTSSIRKSAGSGASFIINGVPFIEKLLAEYEIKKVGIIYRSPKYVPLKTIRVISKTL